MVVLLAFEHEAAGKQRVWMGASVAARSGERRCVACGRQAIVKQHCHSQSPSSPFTSVYLLCSADFVLVLADAAGGTGVVARIMGLATLSTG